MREVDAPSQAKLDKLHAELHALVTTTVNGLIDDRICKGAAAADAPTAAAISDEAVRKYQESHRQDFEVPTAPGAVADNPAVAQQAVRHLLEQHAREAAAAETCRRRRQTHAIEYRIPSADALDRPLPAAQAVADIDGKPLPAADVERAAALRLYRLRGEIVRERQRNLEPLVDELLLAREAARRKTSVAALAAELAALQPVTETELDAFIEAERAQGRPAPARDRARPYLEFQQTYARRAALLSQLRAAARIEVLLPESLAPLLPLDEAGAPALGPAKGQRLVVYSNYRCRPCRASHAELDRLRRGDASVRIVFRDFVPVYDPVATEAAHLVRCAAMLDAFAPMRETLLAREPPPFGSNWFSAEALPGLARAVGIDPARFTACTVDPTVRAQIESDSAHARALGFDEAPAFVAEGVPLSGMQDAEGLARAIREGTSQRGRRR
jgi:protein-disulfide isomerase